MTDYGGMGTIMVEYQLRLSERNVPGAEVAELNPENYKSNPERPLVIPGCQQPG